MGVDNSPVHEKEKVSQPKFFCKNPEEIDYLRLYRNIHSLTVLSDDQFRIEAGGRPKALPLPARNSGCKFAIIRISPTS